MDLVVIQQKQEQARNLTKQLEVSLLIKSIFPAIWEELGEVKLVAIAKSMKSARTYLQLPYRASFSPKHKLTAIQYLKICRSNFTESQQASIIKNWEV